VTDFIIYFERPSLMLTISPWPEREVLCVPHAGILFGHKEEWNPVICGNMDELRKSGTERQVVHDLIHMQNPQLLILQKLGREQQLPEVGKGTKKKMVMGTRLHSRTNMADND
jgi:hypothetical protein